MTKSQRGFPAETGESRQGKNKNNLLKAVAFDSRRWDWPPHFIHLDYSASPIGLLSDLSLFRHLLFFSSQHKWPWRLGRVWAEPSQSRLEKRERIHHHAGSQGGKPACLCVCVCTLEGGCQRRLDWHRSRFQRLSRKWGGNEAADSWRQLVRMGGITKKHRRQKEFKKIK